MAKDDPSLLTLSLVSVLAGIVSYSFCSEPLLGIVLSTIGIGCTAWEVFGKDKALRRFFEVSKLHADEDYPMLLDRKEEPYGVRLMFSIPIGLSAEDFVKRTGAFANYYRARVEVVPWHNSVFVKVFTKDLDDTYPFEVVDTKHPLELVIGRTYGGEPVVIKPTTGSPHILMGGETGSGKSTILRVALTTLIITKNDADIELYLSDLKHGAEFGLFEHCRMVKQFAMSVSATKSMIKEVLGVVDNRYRLYRDNKVNDIKKWNSRFTINKMKYILVVIDEFADLEVDKECVNIMIELARKARAAGVYLWLSTQRPCAQTIDRRIKANVPIVIGLKTDDAVNSRIVMDRVGLEQLKGNGHGVLKANGQETEFQGMWLSWDDAEKLLEPYCCETKEDDVEECGKVEDISFLDMLNEEAL